MPARQARVGSSKGGQSQRSGRQAYDRMELGIGIKMAVPGLIRKLFSLPGFRPSLLLIIVAIALILGLRECILYQEMSSIEIFTGGADLSQFEIESPPWHVVARHAFLPSLLWILCAPIIVYVTQRVSLGRVSLLRLMLTHLVAGIVLSGVLSVVSQYFEDDLPPLFVQCAVAVSDMEMTFLGDFDRSRIEEALPEDLLEKLPLKVEVAQTSENFHPGLVDTLSSPVRISNFLEFFTTYIVMICVLGLVLYHQFIRERDLRSAQLKAQLTSAQLKAIRSRLQPHFLFNTLNGIGTLMGQNVAAARKMLGKLADLLRLSLRTMDRSETTLEEELKFLEKYIDIERARFEDRLTVTLDIDPSASDVLIPSFCLQPLVENAVRHGVGRKAAPGEIVISARCEGDRLVIEVSDDGMGLPANQSHPTLGVGLRNVKQSLHYLHGEDAVMEFESEEEQGFLVRMRMPRRIAERGER